jgi:hypothetical protein
MMHRRLVPGQTDIQSKRQLVSRRAARQLFAMRHWLLAGIFLAFFGLVRALSPDATREQIIAELGKPLSVAKLGQREIMSYPNGVRLELADNRIVSAKGIILAESLAAPLVKPEAPAPAEKDKKPRAVEKAKAEPDFEQARARRQAEMEKAVEGMEASHDAAQHPPPPKAFDFTRFALEAGLKFLLTVAALKLACKYWGAEVFWSGILSVSAADVVVRAGMGLAGTLLLGFPSLFYADEAAGALVMVILLKKLSINHSIAQAIELTMTTKTFSIVVGSLLVTLLLRLLY